MGLFCCMPASLVDDIVELVRIGGKSNSMITLIQRAFHVLPSSVLIPYVMYEHTRNMSAPHLPLGPSGERGGIALERTTEDTRMKIAIRLHE